MTYPIQASYLFTVKRALLVSTMLLSIFVSTVVVAQGNLENPIANTADSGVAVISGWHCDAAEIEILVDGVSLGLAGMGTSRADTQNTCGRSDTGFSLLVNYSNYEEGDHLMTVRVDGEVWVQRNFSTIRPTGADETFTRDIEHVAYAYDFPQDGDVLELQWETAKQGFVSRRSFRNAIPASRLVTNFNRSFFGHSRGYSSNSAAAGPLDAAEFSFEITEDSFRMDRKGDALDDCSYTGSIEFFFSGIRSTGSYSCGNVEGTYTAEMVVNSSDGYYVGRFQMTNNGSDAAISDLQIGVAE